MRLTVPLCAAATAQRLRTVAAIALCTLANTGHAAVFTVTGSGEPGNPASATCDGSNNCGTLREAVNAALASADAASVIRFSNAIDGATINLVWCTNASTGSEFGRSAFFINGNKAIYLDGVQGLASGITIARDTVNAQSCAAPGTAATNTFRLFDVDAGSSLTLSGLTLKNGAAIGGSAYYGGAALGAGGAVFNRGTLTVDRSTFVDNLAQGGDGGDPALSGVYGGAGVGGDASSSNGGPPNGGVFGVQFNGGFGGGGIAYDSGADGGFGGGGGTGGNNGGAGGFGAGGGSYGSGIAGSGGFGGGNGSTTAPSGGGGAGAGMGGAIFNDAGTLTVTNSTFTANRATGGSAPGAGAGSAFGGALFNYSGSATVRFATFARNSVSAGLGNGGAADGGSLYHLNDGNCALGGNSCADPSAMLTIEATIAYADSGAANDLVANAINGGFSSWSCNTVLVASQSGIDPTCTIQNDPLLSPLGHYGGTSPTMVPHQGSAAIDGVGYAFGINYDQRGVARPQGGVFSDYGAVEYDGDYLFGNGFD